MPQNEYLKNQLLKKFIASALPALKNRKPSIRKLHEQQASESDNALAPVNEKLAEDVAAREIGQTTISLVRPRGVQSRQRPRGIRVSR